MRSIRPYRLFQVLWIFPLFTMLLISNNIALAFDWILLPKFKKKAIKDPIFIMSLPRSGTTNLFHGLTTSNSPFTAMSLWEIIFAPSVIQKKTYKFIWKYCPFFLKKIIKRIDENIFKKLNNIHRISLFNKEEDEMIMMWALSSIYLSFFYPESQVMRDLFRFDIDISNKRKNRIMRIYYRMVQRHLYVFNQNNNKRFISKNPSMAAKVEGISSFFPSGKAIVIERDPCCIFPSTEKLQSFLFKLSTDLPITKNEKLAIAEILEDFRMNLQLNLVKKKVMPFIVIRFNDLLNNRVDVFKKLLKWLDSDINLELKDGTSHQTKASYIPLSKIEFNQSLKNPWPTWPNENFLNIN